MQDNDDDHPAVSRPREALRSDAVLLAQVTNNDAITKGKPGKKKSVSRKQRNLLFLFAPKNNKEKRQQKKYAKLRYGVSNPIKVDSWQDVEKTLKKYSLVSHLVIFTHGTEGHLDIGGDIRKGDEIQPFFRGTGAKATRVTIEGCMFGRDPLQMAHLGKGLKAKKVIAFTWWHFTLQKSYGPATASPLDPNDVADFKANFFPDYHVRKSSGKHSQISDVDKLIEKLENDLGKKISFLYEAFAPQGEKITTSNLTSFSVRKDLTRTTVKTERKAKSFPTGKGADFLFGFIVTAIVNSILP